MEIKKVTPIGERSSGYQSTVQDWQKFLKCWAVRQAQFALGRGVKYAPDLNALRLDEPAPTERVRLQIESLEARLGVQLPKSYRDFLNANGESFRFDADRNDDYKHYFLPINKIGWLHEAFSDIYKSQKKFHPEINASDEDYYRYEPDENQFHTYRDRHLDRILVVGWIEERGLLLLNPNEITADGEWEAWEYYWDDNGRYLSFAEMVRMISYRYSYDHELVFQVPKTTLKGTCADLIAPRGN